jgi:hypothetical protein
MNVVVILIGIAIALGLLLARSMDWVAENFGEFDHNESAEADMACGPLPERLPSGAQQRDAALGRQAGRDELPQGQ